MVNAVGRISCRALKSDGSEANSFNTNAAYVCVCVGACTGVFFCGLGVKKLLTLFEPEH